MHSFADNTPLVGAALRSVEHHLGLEKLYVLGTNCGEKAARPLALCVPCS